MNETMELDVAAAAGTDAAVVAHPSGPLPDSPASPDSARPHPAVLDGRYVLGESLGNGGMASVYRAIDTVLDRTVAVKVFNQHSALPDGEVRRAAEVRLLAGMNHPGLVMVYDAGRDDSNPSDPFAYLVMELVDGTTLAKAISHGPLPPTAVAAIGVQLAAALDHVHSRGVVHRDLKPANVLLSHEPDGAVAKLADFGVARLVDSTRLTGYGTTLGTPNYLSPEQATGEEVTPASDIYSLGLVLLEALTGERAYPGFGVEAVVQRLHHQPRIPDRLGPGWTSLLTAMTAAEPSARPNARSTEMALRSLADPAHDPALIAVPQSGGLASGRFATIRKHRRSWSMGALGATAVASGVALAVLLGGSGTQAAANASVPGKLGADLGLLEAVAPQQLRADLADLNRAAANGNRQAARADIGVIAGDLRAMRRDGQVSPESYREVLAALAALSADLRPTRAAGSTHSAAATRPTRAHIARPKPHTAHPLPPVRHQEPALHTARAGTHRAQPPAPADAQRRSPRHAQPRGSDHGSRHNDRHDYSHSWHGDRHGDRHGDGHGDGHGQDGDSND